MKNLIKITALCVVLFCSNIGKAQSTFTVYFDFDKYQLTPTTIASLDSFIVAEKEQLPSFIFQLNGHCDVIGSDEYNNTLSVKRVTAVKNFLVKKGVEASSIGDEIGHGKKELVNENTTEDERQLNRRVEINFSKVITNDAPGVQSLKQKLGDTSIRAGMNIVLKNINFQGGLHRFLPESTPMLEELLDAMKTYPSLVIRIEGHICCESHSGDGADGETGLYNLSEARAKAVSDYLIENNISPNRVSYKGFGHSAPIYPYPEKTEEERIENRRVEIKIISR